MLKSSLIYQMSKLWVLDNINQTAKIRKSKTQGGKCVWEWYSFYGPTKWFVFI